MKSFLSSIKNVLLWSYDRGTWQYDVLCILIIAIIFMVPGRYFGDRDRTGLLRANEVRFSASNPAQGSVEISAEDLDKFLRKENRADLLGNPREGALLYVRERLERNATTARVESIRDKDGRAGYRIWFFKE